MAYSVTLRPAARRALRRLDRPIQKPIAEALRDLAEEPRPQGVKSLATDSELLRIRLGDYRIIYTVDEDAKRWITAATTIREPKPTEEEPPSDA